MQHRVSHQQVRDLALSAYGMYNGVYDGQLLAYHSLGKQDTLWHLAYAETQNHKLSNNYHEEENR
jgi:hypothetical protein